MFFPAHVMTKEVLKVNHHPLKILIHLSTIDSIAGWYGHHLEETGTLGDPSFGFVR